MLLMGMNVFADNFDALWKEVRAAQQKDQPRTEMASLDKIIFSAKKQHAYGHLLSAEVMRAGVQCSIAPDSLADALTRLEKEARGADKSLNAVYAAVLGKAYSMPGEDEDYPKKSKQWFTEALSHADILAKIKATDYEPLVSKGADSRIFGDDMLHVVSMDANNYAPAIDYYNKVGNREAVLLMKLWQIETDEEMFPDVKTKKIDALVDAYGDLPACGEAAIMKYDLLDSDVPAKERMEYITNALERWGSWQHMNVLRNEQMELTAAKFDMGEMSKVYASGKPIKVSLTELRNIPTLLIRINKLKGIDGKTELDPDYPKQLAKLRAAIDKGFQPIEIERQYEGKANYEISADSFEIPALTPGIYLMDAEACQGETQAKSTLLFISNLYTLFESQPDGSIRYAVLDRTSGQPIAGASIFLKGYKSNTYKQTSATLTTDKKGEATLQKGLLRPNYIWVSTKDDVFFPNSNAWAGGYSYYSENRDQQVVNVFTDRSLYRPGQTVHGAAIVYSKKDLTTTVSADIAVTFTLMDANWKEVASKTVNTDAYGTAAADFELPQGGLTGNFTLRANCGTEGSASFHVEEYKRPTFQIDIPEYKDAYLAGDTIELTGYAKSYTGVPIQGAKVSYEVKRKQALWWRYWYNGDSNDAKDLYADSAVTAEDGSFKLRVPLTTPYLGPAEKRMGRFYRFVVEAKVTDQSGETQEATATVPLGTKAGVLTSNMPAKAERDSLTQVTFQFLNAAGQNVEAQVNFSIDGKNYPEVATGKPAELKPMKSGRHELVAICNGDTLKTTFVVFTVNDNVPASNTPEWFYQSTNAFPADGHPVYLQVGSSDENVHVLYGIFSGKKVIDRGTFELSNSIKNYQLKYKPEYGDGITLTFAWVKDGKVHKWSTQITRPVPDKKLNVTWKTFRDRLTPGQTEEWTAVITRNGKPAAAQLLATMFDKSLDQIYKHEWAFGPSFHFSVPNVNWYTTGNSPVVLSSLAKIKYLNPKSPVYRMFDDNWFGNLVYAGPSVYGYRRGGIRMNRVMLSKTAAPMAMNEVALAGSARAVEENKVFDCVPTIPDDADMKEDAEEEKAPTLRENLAETAFFYPQLETAQDGSVAIKFTLPEALTTWRFMGIAHDKDVNFGMLNGETVAQKTVMVQPNMPRFVREGDNATVAAKIFNTSDKTVSGTSTLTLLDPATLKTVYRASEAFNADANGTASVSFNVPSEKLAGYDMLIARTTAEGNGYSDGEQHYLPVLPNRERVTNTLPFTQNEAGKKEIDLNKLFPADAKQRSLTVEYTNNPAWLMLQALPYVADANEKNAIALAAAFYANSLAKNILNASPKIKQTIELWRQEKGAETSLMSSLEKDESLKQLVLSETPWVADAKNETEQKQQLVRFFDENSISMKLSGTLNDLKKLQLGDGSFSWWPGMRGSFYITTAVTKMLVRLNKLIGNQSATKEMLYMAFRFMDSEAAEEVRELKRLQAKGVKNLAPSETACDYLYSSALAGRTQTADMKYLINLLASKPVDLTIYGKANTAVILSMYGQQKKAAEYLQSVNEYTVYKEEMGRYFDTPKAQYSWFDYRIPSQTAAIEAYQMLKPHDKNIDEMRRWLLQEKRTQAWDTPINSVNAVYAFMKDNVKVLDTQEPSVITMDGNMLDMPQATAGMGYVKTTTEPGRTLSFNKTSTGTSWGAVYAQFMQPMTSVADASSGITVKRELLTADGTKKVDNLKVGDKVKVRITIKADRDYDFVEVIDKRAACLEPVNQLSGYRWGYYLAPHDNNTCYYFDQLPKGKTVVETDYYIDREGNYSTGTCTAQCAYAPEYMGRTKAITLNVK